MNHGKDPRRNLQKSIRALQRSLRIDPDLTAVIANLGFTYSSLGEYEMDHGHDPLPSLNQSVKYLEKARTKGPSILACYIELVYVHGNQGKHRLRLGEDPSNEFLLAEASFRDGIRIDSKDVFLHTFMATIPILRAELAVDRNDSPIAELRKAHLPVYVVLGDENYVMKEAAPGMIAALLPGKEKDLNLEVVEGAGEDWDRIIPALQTYPWFGQRRVIVVKDTKVFFSKFLLEDVIAKSRIKYETGSLAEAVKRHRFVLGHQGYKKILDIADEAFPQLPGYQPHSKTEVWLNAVIEECRRKGLDPIPYEDNSEKLLKALGRDGKGIAEKNTLILVTDHVDRRKSLYKVINEIGAVIDFSVSP